MSGVQSHVPTPSPLHASPLHGSLPGPGIGQIDCVQYSPVQILPSQSHAYVIKPGYVTCEKFRGLYVSEKLALIVVFSTSMQPPMPTAPHKSRLCGAAQNERKLSLHAAPPHHGSSVVFPVATNASLTAWHAVSAAPVRPFCWSHGRLHVHTGTPFWRLHTPFP